MKFSWRDQNGNLYWGLPVDWPDENGKIYVGIPGNKDAKPVAIYEMRELVIDSTVKLTSVIF